MYYLAIKFVATRLPPPFMNCRRGLAPQGRVKNTVLKILRTGQGRYMIVVTMKSFLRGYNDGLLIVFRARN